MILRYFVISLVIGKWSYAHRVMQPKSSSEEALAPKVIPSMSIEPHLLRGISGKEWLLTQKSHNSATVTNDQLKILANLSSETRFMGYLRPIAVPRVAGTTGNFKVQKFLESRLQDIGFKVEKHNFLATPPSKFGGAKNMTNIFGTLDPAAPRRMVLACHFDSKHDTYGQFIGVTDSAVPCAQILDIAATLQPFLQQRTKNLDVTLQLLFFDGEEAFGDWSSKDSLYGARTLSEKMKSTRNKFAVNDETLNELHSMDVLVLLDLIGAKDTTLRNFYYNIKGHFERLHGIETKMTQSGLIKRWGRTSPYFDMRPLEPKKWVDDDYRPFLEKGVKVLHLISTPFPAVWHKLSDNLANIHYNTIDDLNKILRVY